MPMTFNNDQYFGSLRRRIEATERNVQQVVAKTAADAFSGIVEKTPVDTGRARASWQFRPIDRFSYMIVSESTSYILRLEFGGYPGQGPKTQPGVSAEPATQSFVSTQAPQGMVRLTLMEIERPFRAELREAVVDGWRAA